MSEPEVRYAELRVDDAGVLSGVVMPYGSVARIGSFEERFEPGSLEYRDVIANLQHDRTKPVVRTGAGLQLADSPTELRAVMTLPDTAPAREARELVDAKIVRGLSVEFLAIKERWEGNLRIIQRAQLMGFALVDRPAYPDSVIAKRMAEHRPTPRRKAWL